MLLDESFLRRLEQTSLVTRRVRPGQLRGERRSTKRGTSVEFADYRDYSRGDDLRRIDWNIYARLERPFVKLFEEEEDLSVHLLLDASSSMGWGEGQSDTDETLSKWDFARQLTAALGYIALISGDRLTVTALFGSSASLKFGPVRGRGHVLRLLEWVEELSTRGTTDLSGGLRTQGFQSGRAGLTVLVSDLFSPTGFMEGLSTLAARGHDIVLLHTLSPEEIEPQIDGDLLLLDIETGDGQEVTVNDATRAMYTERVKYWQNEIGSMCHSRDITYIPIRCDSPLEQVVLTKLKQAKVLR